MKKFILSLSVLFGLSGATMAQTLSAPDVEALPGETVTATINMTAPAGIFTGFQMELSLPVGGFTIAESGAVKGWDGLVEYHLREDGTLKIAAAAAKPFETTDLTIEFTVDANAPLGEYEIPVTNQFEGPAEEGGTVKEKRETSFTVKVVDRHNIVLDEDATAAPESIDGVVNVTLKRTIAAGDWSSICLPFAATGEQVKAAFGEDVELADFTAWESEENEEGGIAAIKVTFTPADTEKGIKANTPMLIKVSEAVESADFEGVTINVASEPCVQVGQRAAERGYFYGTYAATQVPEENLFLSGNKFWYSTGATAIKGYRGYFEFRDVLDAYYDNAAEVKISLVIDDNETGIKTLDAQQASETIYNLAGQRVSKAQSGITIVNGKKVLK